MGNLDCLLLCSQFLSFQTQTLRFVFVCVATLSLGFFPFQDCVVQASMRSPNMETFKQQKVEDFYDIGEELGR